MSHVAEGRSVRERPIIFSGPMVTAILRGEKTQTRRVVKQFPARGHVQELRDGSWEHSPDGGFDWGVTQARCPYGQPGERLWVKEAWSTTRLPNGWPAFTYAADGPHPHGLKWRPSLFMPRWASRLTLEVTSVRVERLQDITVADVVAEGIDLDGEHADDFLNAERAQAGGLSIPCDHPEVYPFVRLWDSINAKRGHAWDTNPWVWVVEFRKVEA